MIDKPKVVVLTANRLRHNYFTKVVAENFDLSGVITQPKREYYAREVYKSDRVRRHFKKLSVKEQEYFGECSGYIQEHEKFDLLEIDDINENECIKWVQRQEPDVVFLFGTRVLSLAWFDAFKNIVNLHLGLSPFYRGSATLFWPFVNEELCCVGVTIHLAVKEVDAGPIIQRIKPTIEVGDDYYEINYKTIKSGIDKIPKSIHDYLNGNIQPLSQHELKKGLLYKKVDFSDEALEQALQFVGGGVTIEQLEKSMRHPRCKCLQ